MCEVAVLVDSDVADVMVLLVEPVIKKKAIKTFCVVPCNLFHLAPVQRWLKKES